MFIHRCTLCNSDNPNFTSLQWLQDKLTSFGFPYPIKNFETLSYRHYACSSCGSSDRERLYKLYIDKYIKDKKIKLVDFAPSVPLQKYLKSKKNINYRSADLMMVGVDDKVDITDMKKYKDNTFDFFVCSHIMEHVSDDSKAMRELFRILKPGGEGILMTPIMDRKGVFDADTSVTDIPERWRRFAQDDHVRLYEKDIFMKRVRDSGFKIEQHDFRSLGLVSILRNGIRLKSRLYIVKKVNDGGF